MEIEMTDQEFLVRLKNLHFSDEFIQTVDLFVPKEIRRALRDETLTAIAAAWESMKAIKATPATLIEVKSGGDNDFLTAADKASHDAIFNQLAKSGYADPVLAEESNNRPKNPLSIPRLWIVDELDGTNNAKELRKGLYSTCVGFMEEGKMQSVAVANPVTGEIWYAQKGLGCYYSDSSRADKKCQVRQDEDLHETHMSTDPYYDDRVYDAHVGTQLELIKQLKARNITKRPWLHCDGSAVLNLARVAQGATGVYFHWGLSPWDQQAALLVEEAGGVVRDLDGENNDVLSRGIVAGNKILVEQLISITKGRYSHLPKEIDLEEIK